MTAARACWGTCWFWSAIAIRCSWVVPLKAFVQSILQNTLRIRARILMNGLRLEWSCDLLMQLVSIEGGRVDYENFEECGKLDLYWVPYVLEIIQVGVCGWLASAIVASNREADSEKSMTQVYNSLSREIVMYVQKDLKIALWPRQWSMKRCGRNTDNIRSFRSSMRSIKNDRRKKKRRRKK